jgi:hypothetical protein
MSIFSNMLRATAEDYLKAQLEDLKTFFVLALAIYDVPSDADTVIHWVETGCRYVVEHGTPTEADVRAHLGGG